MATTLSQPIFLLNCTTNSTKPTPTLQSNSIIRRRRRRRRRRIGIGIGIGFVHPSPYPTIPLSPPFLSTKTETNSNFNFKCFANPQGSEPSSVSDGNSQRPIQALLWLAEAIYILWLFLLPFAPGDPVWAISSQTIDSLIGLSLNFFFILPLINADDKVLSFIGRVVGIHAVEAPVLHPMSEGLFNFVIAWTFMFAPLLFTDTRRDRYKASSLDLLWGLQMFLTNTFLIPYMAIRLNEAGSDDTPRGKRSRLGSLMARNASFVGLSGGAVCLVSVMWAFFGRMDGNFGGIAERWGFLVTYLGSERLAYAFIWDICLYMVFQPWLIGDNLQNVEQSKVDVVKYVRFVPVLGLIAYLVCLNHDD